MDIKIAICDDERHHREYAAGFAKTWADKNKFNANMTFFESAESFIDARDDGYHCDILLLDIQMDGQSGVELAKKLRETDEKLIIIFVTAMPDFIQEGYDVSALHYLMKPVDEEKLYAVLDRGVKQLNKDSRMLLLPVDGEMMRIPAEDILCIESFAHELEITTKDGAITVRMPAYKLERKLGDYFIRCHRSYIVGLKHISKITKTDVILDNGKQVPLSRRAYDKVNKAWISYFKGISF